MTKVIASVGKILMCSVVGFCASDTLPAAEDRPAVEVLNPKADMQVDMVEFVEGRLEKRDGKHPVIVIKSLDVGGQPWWVQESVTDVNENGVFEAQATFGRDQDKGVRFAVMIFLAKDKVTAMSYKPGQQLFTLPEAPQSKIVRVMRRK